MTIPLSRVRTGERLTDDGEVTQPDVWLEDADLRDDSSAFYEAKTDPALSIDDEFAKTIPNGQYRLQNRSREQALIAFLDTVRRVFGGELG